MFTISFFKKVIFLLSIVTLLTISHVQGQSQKNKFRPKVGKLNKLTLDKIYERNSKVIFKDKLFDELNDTRVNQGLQALKKKLLKYKNKIAYGILRFENDKKLSVKSKLSTDNKYNESVWILVYSYKLHPESMLVFIDLFKDGFTYNDNDLSIDEVGYITPTSFKVLPVLGESSRFASFFVPYTTKNGIRKKRRIRISHGAVESDYYFFYKQAVNCIKNPYPFRPLRGTLITFSSECISSKRPRKKTVPFKTVSSVKRGETKIPISNDPDIKTVLISNPEKPVYQRLSCVGVGRLGNKCVIYNPDGWKPLK